SICAWLSKWIVFGLAELPITRSSPAPAVPTHKSPCRSMCSAYTVSSPRLAGSRSSRREAEKRALFLSTRLSPPPAVPTHRLPSRSSTIALALELLSELEIDGPNGYRVILPDAGSMLAKPPRKVPTHSVP